MAISPKTRFGGSFAPPVDDAQLASYEALIGACGDRRTKEHLLDLLNMLRLFRVTGASSIPGTKHPAGVGLVVPLEDAEIDRLWDVVPYKDECDNIAKVFERLPNGETRDAAFHLLWFAYELTADREPITNDKL